MTEFAVPRSVVACHRPWVAPAFIMGAFTAFNVLYDPFREPIFTWTHMFGGGLLYIEPVLFGIWAALGPPPAIKRISLTAVALAAILFVPAVCHTLAYGEIYDTGLIPVLGGLFVPTTLVFLAFRKFLRWRLDEQGTSTAATAGSGFSLRYMLTFTAIIAALLAAGRILSWTYAAELVDIAQIAYIGMILLALFAAVMIPLATLCVRLPAGVIATVPFVWLTASGLFIYATFRLDPHADLEEGIHVAIVQLGAAAGGLLAALVLRFNGYRLLRRGDT
jgi:hypothetical protein